MYQFSSVQSVDRSGRRGHMTDDSAEMFFQCFLQEAIVSSSGIGWDAHSLMLSIKHSLRRPRRRPPSNVPLEDGFGEAVVASDMPEPCKLPSLDSCQKRFLWTHKEVDLASHPFIGLVRQVGDAEKFPQTLGFESLDHFFSQSQQAGSMFHSQRGGWR